MPLLLPLLPPPTPPLLLLLLLLLLYIVFGIILKWIFAVVVVGVRTVVGEKLVPRASYRSENENERRGFAAVIFGWKPRRTGKICGKSEARQSECESDLNVYVYYIIRCVLCVF